MQTLASGARTILCWNRTSLPHGAYRLTNIRQLEQAPDLTGYTDCTNEAQFSDELRAVLATLTVENGLWLGLTLGRREYAEVVALLAE